jgi:membrane fusion protein (multidrug efflux system)
MPLQTDTTTDESKSDQPHAAQAKEGTPKTSQDKPEASQDLAKRRRTIFFGVIAAVLVIAGCLVWWLHSRHYESTDDAQVDGYLNPIAARVDGTITAVYVQDNQKVKAGQPIVDLDPRDAEVSLAQAQADYDGALAQLKAEIPNLPIQRVSNQSDLSSAQFEVVNDEAAVQGAENDYDSDVAKLRQAQATSVKSESDLLRYKQLMDKAELAQVDYDQYVSTAKSNAASVDAAAATVASQAKLIEQRRAQLREQQAKTQQTVENGPQQVLIKNANNGSRAASVEAYKAKLDQAILNVAYCHVVAPVDGIVLQRSAEVGGRITSGQQLLMIAQVDDPWVVANFKETQVRKMHPGQSVDIKVDALGKSFMGSVESMPAATGDRASVLPAENATGNYVKVIQRLPVRILFKSGQAGIDQLRPGMSVEPNVHLN